MLKNQPKRRNTVTVEDRRAVMVLAKARKPGARDAGVKMEDFVRRELKARLGWPQTEPASEALKAAAKEIAGVVSKQLKDAEAKAKADAAEKVQTEELSENV